MPFACGAQTENETQATFRRVRLVGVPQDAGVEQGRGFERIFVKKIGADQLRWTLEKLLCAASACSISSARDSNVSSRLRCRPWKFSSTSASWLATASESR